MVSSVLAQAILNQKAPDLVGSFREGQEISRQGKVKELSSLALKEGGGESLDQLIDLDPEVGLALGEHIGARSAKDLNDFIASAKIGLNQLNNGDVQGFISFGEQRIATLKQQGRNTVQTEEAINLAKSGDAEGARQRLQGLVGSIDLAKTTSGNQDRDRLLKDLNSDNPDVVKSARIALKLESGAGNLTEKQKIALDPELARNIASTQANIRGASAGASERAKLGVQGAMKPQVDAAITFAKEQAKNAASALKTGKSDTKALNVYESAMAGLVSSFEDANTGPVRGLLPAIADDDRVLEASISIMSPVLKSVVRGAGEGTFTDNDQKQIDNLMPTRKDNKEVARKKVELLDAFVRSKLSAAEQKSGEGAQPPANAQQKQGGKIMVDGNGNRAIVFPDGTFEELP